MAPVLSGETLDSATFTLVSSQFWSSAPSGDFGEGMAPEIDLHTFGIFNAVNTELALELADMGYMTASIWAANRGFDFDEMTDCVDMQSIRVGSAPEREDSDESRFEWDGCIWESAK